MGRDGTSPRFSIPTRIFLAFALTLASFTGVAVTSVVQHDETARRLRLLHDGYLPLALRLGEARGHQNVFRRHVERLLESPAELRWLQAARQVRPSTMRRLEADLERAKRLAESVGEGEVLVPLEEALSAISADYDATQEQYPSLMAALESGEDARAVHAQIAATELSIERRYRDAYGRLVDRIDALASSSSDQARGAAVVLGVLASLALLLGLGATFWSQRLLGPLPRLQSRVAAVAEGDLSVREPDPKRDDEIGRLARGFEDMVLALATRDTRLGELRRTQEQIVAGLRAAVVVLDKDDVVRASNPASERILGVHVGDAWASTSLQLYELDEALARVRGEGETCTLEAQSLPGERFVDVRVGPFGDELGQVLVVIEDVTDALRTKDRLIRSERLAAIGRMAAHVTHEVRNPLSSIGLNVEMLADELGEGDAEAHALIRAIQKEIDRLTAITEEYLRLARLPAPRLEAEDVEDLLQSIASFLRREMERDGVTLSLELEEPLPSVALDEGQLRQALVNLLRNAREAMSEGGTVRLVARAQAGGVEIVVEDEGPGIPEDMRARVFDLFYTTKERGSGLGLPLTQQIVVAHDGAIRCTTAASGRGTRFEIWLPAAGEREAA
ncbi:MAG: HAMP domain-containing protein [Sandaracinus sp.]|nr:HAMP domain-containing protein [Sandaracinus sp.]MCB9611521.1 HAMP domain-containing protein [Sandaracinus sp.]